MINYKMSVITPAFPCMNSSHMITDTTLEIINNFFKEAYRIITQDIIKARIATWSELFTNFDFFNVKGFAIIFLLFRNIIILQRSISQENNKPKTMNSKPGKGSLLARSENYTILQNEATFLGNQIIIILILRHSIQSCFLSINSR